MEDVNVDPGATTNPDCEKHPCYCDKSCWPHVTSVPDSQLLQDGHVIAKQATWREKEVEAPRITSERCHWHGICIWPVEVPDASVKLWIMPQSLYDSSATISISNYNGSIDNNVGKITNRKPLYVTCLPEDNSFWNHKTSRARINISGLPTRTIIVF